jgi:Rrf2 family protein
MATDNRFAVAVHALALLTFESESGTPLKSEFLAQHINTNPVVVRRILSSLAKARLVTSQAGANGGSRLARSPENISLLEIYRAVNADNLFSLEHKPSPASSIGQQMQTVLDEIVEAADAALAGVLCKITLADVFQSVCERGGHDPSHRSCGS